MQPNHSMDNAAWDHLIAEVAHLFDDLTLKRGFQYYKQKRVQAFRMITGQRIMSLVEGREDYAVTLELDHLQQSHCDCPVSGPCKHMVAVLMRYAELQGRPVHSIANAKGLIDTPRIRKAEPSVPGVPQGQNEQLKKLAALVPEGTLQQWREYITLVLTPLAHTVRNPQYADRALAAIAGAQPKLPPAAAMLFKLQAHLAVLESLVKPGQALTAGLSSLGYSVGYYTSIAISELQNRITDMMKQPLPLAAAPEEWPRVYDTIAYLRKEMLTETRDRSRDQPYFSSCYALLWNHWITPNLSGPELYTEELKQLQLTSGSLNKASSPQPLLLAEARMYYLLKDDAAARERLRLAGERPGLHPEELLGFILPLAETRQWTRLTEWLAEIGPLLGGRLYNLHEYAGYWDDAVRHLPEAETLMWDTLSGMLPLSREIYDEQLLAYGKWQEWMDVQLSTGKEPGDFRVSDLQPVEKHAPELLLPFYHQAVERFVLEKNRPSYKAAVKLLKRLSKLYKKLKREERWEAFLEAFTSRNSRLRALQEELRKGKLIP
ncbi:SWIM zinc finger family protein [Paenibacillus sp. MMS20-IR301]|uniref:SWIM zinc finger family protein n=1 Tax=Paenibacillus sp. MMS20-IR301 TaxID=2895946 RepID=UPI0028EA3D5D|nr:SWIM zinc finger family protein [Paenibacillus sp. MMS20-IR301]WNS41969.1 SWIM zinc finger family protein [Paenibacillus sp. MMS20-IR301]